MTGSDISERGGLGEDNCLGRARRGGRKRNEEWAKKVNNSLPFGVGGGGEVGGGLCAQE